MRPDQYSGDRAIHAAREKIFDGFLFRPEVAEQVARVARKHDPLLRDQLFERRMPLAYVFLGG